MLLQPQSKQHPIFRVPFSFPWMDLEKCGEEVLWQWQEQEEKQDTLFREEAHTDGSYDHKSSLGIFEAQEFLGSGPQDDYMRR